MLSPILTSISRENIIEIPLTSKKRHQAELLGKYGARRFVSREKQVFLVGFSIAISRFPRKPKDRLNTSLPRTEKSEIIRSCLKKGKRKGY